MAHARIRLHGSLLDFLSRAQRGLDRVQAFSPPASVKDVVEAVGVPHPEVDCLLVDGAAVKLDHRLTGDCEIAAYPATCPPEPLPAVRAGEPPPTPLRFVLDVHLGKLASALRMLGFDAVWSNTAEDAALAQLSSSEERILLTRDVGLLKRGEVRHGYFPRRTLISTSSRRDLRVSTSSTS